MIVSTLNSELDRHRAQLLGCQACGLREGIRPIVSQARDPRVMLVGQAPGKVEAAGGRPFAGRAGKTLFAWFASVALEEDVLRRQMYIAAVTRCFPGAHPSGRGDRVPSSSERANCARWLERELAIIRPRLVIPVGRLAIEALIGPQPLDRVIGRELTLPVQGAGAGALVIALPHPSGASSWVHAPAHQRLLRRALDLIGRRWREIHAGRRAA